MSNTSRYGGGVNESKIQEEEDAYYEIFEQEARDFKTNAVAIFETKTAILEARAKYLKFLVDQKTLLVPRDNNNLQIWSIEDMAMEYETQNEEPVNCAIGTLQYYFVGLENCEILVFLSYGNNLVRKI